VAAALPPSMRPCSPAELDLFPQWCVQREFGQTGRDAEQQAWQGAWWSAHAALLAQPVVAVHADWMPRNLMVCERSAQPRHPGLPGRGGGPITYDLASLLRDAFLSRGTKRRSSTGPCAGGSRPAPPACRWTPTLASSGAQLEWTGLQRHLRRVLGVFCRLKHRDGKAWAYAPGPAALLRLRHARWPCATGRWQARCCAAGAAVGRGRQGRLHLLASSSICGCAKPSKPPAPCAAFRHPRWPVR
jgi:aminoglycoside/choline kinase family phosphotransferase